MASREYTAEELGIAPKEQREYTAEELGIPKPAVSEARPTPEKRPIEPGKVGGAGLAGMAAGAALPYAMQAAGMIPSPLSPFLTAGSQILKGVRGATVLGGGLSGAGGEALKQAERRYGSPDKSVLQFPGVNITREDVAGTVGEFAGPGLPKAGYALIKGVPPVRSALGALDRYSRMGGDEVFKEAATRQLATLRGRDKATEGSYYREVFNALQKADESTKSQANQQLAQATMSADQVLQSSRRKAEQILSTDKEAANKIIADGQLSAQKLIDDAIDQVAAKTGIRQRAIVAKEKAGAAPQQTLNSIGNPQSKEADIGGGLQQRVTKNISDEQKVLNDAYKADRDIAQGIVNQKQASGLPIKDTEAAKKYLDFLNQQLLEGKYAKESKFAPVTEPALKKVFKEIRSAIIDQRIKVGEDEEGKAIYRSVPTAYEAIDHVRRRLGQAFEGNSVEGWAGLLKNEAKEAYRNVRAMQVEYGGGKDGPVDMLLRNYSEGKDLLNSLNIPAGKKISKTDLINPEYLVYDPSNLPSEFFKTRKSVQDLLNVTKDPQFVERSASDYVARLLKDKDKKFTEKYLFDNKEWIDLFPGLKGKIENHISSLRRAESVVPKTTELAKGLRTEIKSLPIKSAEASEKAKKDAVSQAEKLLKESKSKAAEEIKQGQKQAKEITGQVGKFRELVGTGDPVKEIEKLIVGGQTQKLAAVAPYIKSDPELLNSFNKAIDVTLSRSNPTTISDDFERIIKPALENTGLITAEKSKELNKRIRTVQMTLEPGAAAQTIRWIIGTAFVGELGQKFAPEGEAVIKSATKVGKELLK